MRTLPLRLHPGDDVREALQRAVRVEGVEAAFVVSGIGSLASAAIRYAGADRPTLLRGDLEIVGLAGSVSPDGCHLHVTVADAEGAVRGGHLAPGSTVRTTAEVLLALLPEWHFGRAPDPATGYLELTIAPR